MKDELIGRIIAQQYTIISKLSEGATGTLYLAEDTRGFSATRQVALKRLKQRVSLVDVEEMLTFKNKVFSLDGFNHPNVVRIIELLQENDYIFIVMEYLPGKSLQDILDDQTRPISIEDAVHISIQTARALEYIHHVGVLHRDIKPANIMLLDASSIDPRTKAQSLAPLTGYAIKVVDFGIADIIKLSSDSDQQNEASRQSGRRAEHDDVFGTFAYMSPEQIREYGPGTDERSDLYSLGVLLYRMITGVLPFVGDDIHSIIYQHIAKIPDPPVDKNHDIPPALSDAVLKLLEKEPERRYQSAHGLVHDLACIQNGEEHFEIGRHDRPGRLRYRTGFVGRERELEQLHDVYRQAVAGTGSFVIISGEEGVGKTFLLEQFRKDIRTAAACTIGVRCRSDERAIAYGILRTTLDAYIDFFNIRTAPERKRYSKSIQETAGLLGGVLVAINSRMTEIIGEVRPLLPLEKDREHRRFLSAVTDFFYSLSTIEKGLVIFYEDLHRADESSLMLLAELAHGIGGFPLLIVGTCRDTDIDYGHGMKSLIIAARSNPRIIQVPLERFDLSLVARYVAGLLNRDADDETVRRLTGIIVEKSGGNPLCVRGLLNYLFDERIVSFDRQNTLQVDEALLNTASLPASIIDIFLKRVSYCTDMEKEIITCAAVIGYRFMPEFLAECCGDLVEQGYATATVITAALIKGIDLRLLETSPEMPGMISFSHDTVRELFYNALDEAERKSLHRRVAAVLEKHMTSTPDSTHNPLAYEIAYHAIEAGAREDDYTHIVSAGMAAMESHAYDHAIRFLSSAVTLLEGKAEKTDELVRLNRAMADAFVIVGRYDEAIVVYQSLIQALPNRFERAYLYKQISHAYFKKGDFENNERFASIGLGMLGERLPIARAAVFWGIVKEYTLQWTPTLPRMRHDEKSAPADERYSLIIWFYYALSWAYIINDTQKFFRTILRMFNLAKKKSGETIELGLSQALLGAIYFTLHSFTRSMQYLNRSLDIRTHLNDEWGVGQTYQFMGFCHYFRGDFTSAGQCFSRSRKIFKEIGDIKEYSMTIMGIILRNLVVADYEAARIAIDEFNSIALATDDKLNIGYAPLFRGHLFFEIGDYEKAIDYLDRADAIGKEHGLWVITCDANVQLCRLYVATGNYDRALEKINYSRKLKNEKNLLDDTANFLYLFNAEAFMAWYAGHSWTDPVEKSRCLKKIQRACRTAARKNKKSVIHIGHISRLMAKYHALARNNKKAEELFHSSIQYYLNLGVRRELAVSRFDYALFLRDTGRMEDYRSQMEKSYAGFMDIGDGGSLGRIESMLGIKRKAPVSGISELVHKLRHEKKIAAIMELSGLSAQDISFEAILARSLDRAMQIVGAERGCIIKKDDRSFVVVVAKNINNLNNEYLSKTIVYRTLNTATPLVTTNAEEDNEFSDIASVSYFNLKSIMSVPVIVKGEVVGAFYCDNSFAESLFSEDDVEIARAIMAQVSTVLAQPLGRKIDHELVFLEPGDAFCRHYEITPREREVLGLIVKGYTRKGIAAKLSISWVTAHNHIYNIYAKTGARSKTGLIALLEGNQNNDAGARENDPLTALLPEPTNELCRRYEITSREREVMALIVKGYTRKGIAEKLVISRATANVHIYNIYQKTSAKSKTDLIRLMHQFSR